MKENYLLYAGGTSKRKNIDYLIEEYINLPLELRNKHPLIIVTGSNKKAFKKLKTQYRKNPEIKILGFVNDELLSELYSKCKLFIFPSVKEGLGLTVLEAIGCGASAIVANNSSLKEIVQENKFRFDLEKGELTELIKKILSTPQDLQTLKELSISVKNKYRWLNESKNIRNIVSNYAQRSRNKNDLSFASLGLRHRSKKDCETLGRLLYLNFIPNIFIEINSIHEKTELVSFLEKLKIFLEKKYYRYYFMPNLIPITYDSSLKEYSYLFEIPKQVQFTNKLPLKNNDYFLRFKFTYNPNNFSEKEKKLNLIGVRLKYITTCNEILDIIDSILQTDLYIHQFNKLLNPS